MIPVNIRRDWVVFYESGLAVGASVAQCIHPFEGMGFQTFTAYDDHHGKIIRRLSL